MSDSGIPANGQPIIGLGGIVTRPWYRFFTLIFNRLNTAQGGTVVPTGIVMDFAGPPIEIPIGWLACGQTVSRGSFANLFAVIGTSWGAGDGSTTFDLPPQNIFAKGLGSGQSVGDTGGAATVSLSVGQLPAHNHPVIDPGHIHAITDPGHVHASLVANSVNTTGIAVGATQAGNTANATTGITVNSHPTGVTTDNTGSGTPVGILPPYGAFLKIIKT